MKRIRVITAEGKELTFDDDRFDTPPPLLRLEGTLYALDPHDLVSGPAPAIRTYHPAPVVSMDPPVEAAPKPAGNTLRNDGPTLLEYVKAGYTVAGYPPQGYAAKPYTAAERQEALAIEEGKRAPAPEAKPPADPAPEEQEADHEAEIEREQADQEAEAELDQEGETEK